MQWDWLWSTLKRHDEVGGADTLPFTLDQGASRRDKRAKFGDSSQKSPPFTKQTKLVQLSCKPNWVVLGRHVLVICLLFFHLNTR